MAKWLCRSLSNNDLFDKEKVEYRRLFSDYKFDVKGKYMELGNLRKTGIVRMRNYGRIIQDMVLLAANEQDVEKQQSMTIYIAQCMRQKNAQWNKEQESGVERLKEDICILSSGVLKCDFPEFDEVLQKLSQRPMAALDRQNSPKKKKK
jgi:hypothetical protein